MHSTSRQRKELFSIDKENAEQLNKMPTADVFVRKVTSPSGTKLRKNSDVTDDRLPRMMRGLQVTTANILNNAPRRRIQSSSDSVSTKAFVKPRFEVYDDGTSSRSSREKPEIESSSKVKDIQKWLSSVNKAILPPRNAVIVEKKKDDEKLSRQKLDTKKSPKNLPIISKPVIRNIKEMHNKKSIAKKTPKAAYEVLSLNLAYNIEYMSEYIRFQMEMNEKRKLSSSFLKRGVSVDQRRLIVKYLIDSTTYYKSPSFVLYQAVKIFDMYIDRANVSLYELQIIALAALWIAMKKDLTIDDIPEAATIMQLAANSHKDGLKPLLDSEKKILLSLQFEVNYPDPFSMLALYAIMVEEVRELEAGSIQQLYYCGSYLMDLSMLDMDLCDVQALHLAEICAEIALVLVMTNNEKLKEDSRWTYWRARLRQSNPILEKYLLPSKEVNFIRNQLLQKAALSWDKNRDYYSVYKKYCTKRYGAISVFLTTKISSFYMLKIVEPNNLHRPIVF